MNTEELQKLLDSIFNVHIDGGEIDCDGCDLQISYLAERVAKGATLHELLPAMEAHLRCCSDCREEFEALVAVIRAERASEEPQG